MELKFWYLQNEENVCILSTMSANLRSRSVILGCARAQRSFISFWAPLALALRHNQRRLLKLWLGLRHSVRGSTLDSLYRSDIITYSRSCCGCYFIIMSIHASNKNVKSITGLTLNEQNQAKNQKSFHFFLSYFY